jgi:hypothetical protein
VIWSSMALIVLVFLLMVVAGFVRQRPDGGRFITRSRRGAWNSRSSDGTPFERGSRPPKDPSGYRGD